MKIEINKRVNLSKLHDELLIAGVKEKEAYFGEDYFIANDDVDTNIIQQIIDTHDPTPLPQINEDEELQKAIETASTLEELKLALTGKLLPNQKGKS